MMKKEIMEPPLPYTLMEKYKTVLLPMNLSIAIPLKHKMVFEKAYYFCQATPMTFM